MVERMNSKWLVLFLASLSVCSTLRAQILIAPEQRPLERQTDWLKPHKNALNQEWRKLLEEISIYRYTVSDLSDREVAQKWWS